MRSSACRPLGRGAQSVLAYELKWPVSSERARELDVLSGLVARQGGPGVALIFGEPGSGKTRLLAEARRRLPFEACFSMAGFEPERHVPLAAASSLLRELDRVRPAGAELRALFSASSAETGALEPIRIFEAVHLVLASLQPVLLSLDDLQWADELSLALCHYLVRAAAYTGDDMTLVAASRQSQAANAFSSSVQQVLAGGRVPTIELDPLSREEGIELAVARAPNLEPSAAEQIWERAAGSPFWIEALVRADGGVDASGLVSQRLRGTSGDASSLLALLAVAGRPLLEDEAASLQHWPPQRLGSAAAELANRGLTLESGGALRPAHDLIREAAHGGLPDELRRTLHRRLAARLEANSKDDLGELRAALEHRRLGGLPVLPLALRLARASRRTLLGRDGLGLLTAILDESDPTDDEASELEEAVASLAFDLADYRLAFERWAAVAEWRPDPAGRAAAVIRAARAACLAECPEESRAFLARARELGVGDPVVALELETAELFLDGWIGPITVELLAPRPRVAATARALAARKGGYDQLDARTRRACLDALEEHKIGALVQGQDEALIVACDEIAAGARGFDEEIALGAQVWKHYALMQLGRLAESELELRRIWLESRRRAMPKVAIDAGYWLLRVLEDRARVHEADVIASELGELAGRMGDPVELRRVELQRRRLDLLGAGWQQARRRIEAAAPVEPYAHQRLQYHAVLALFAARVGGRSLNSAALESRAKADIDAASAGCLRCSTERDLEGAEILARAGRAEEARACLETWDAKRPDPRGLEALSRRRTDALLAALEGERERAVDALETVQAESERIDAVLFGLWTSLDLARILSEADRTRSADILRNTSERAELLGLVALSELAEQGLRNLGVRTWTRRGAAPARSGLDALSDREREIARLAASGASNPEIAQAVFLSRKTVERHLSSVFAKLGVRNRTELAAQIASLAPKQ
jgi:DNA-binding NarL/FixJ family response regulator